MTVEDHHIIMQMIHREKLQEFKLAFIKNHFRSSINQERLNSLAILSTENKLAGKLTSVTL